MKHPTFHVWLICDYVKLFSRIYVHDSWFWGPWCMHFQRSCLSSSSQNSWPHNLACISSHKLQPCSSKGSFSSTLGSGVGGGLPILITTTFPELRAILLSLVTQWGNKRSDKRLCEGVFKWYSCRSSILSYLWAGLTSSALPSWSKCSFSAYLKLVVQSLSHVWLFCDCMDYSPPGSSVHGISQASLLEGVAFLSPASYGDRHEDFL